MAHISEDFIQHISQQLPNHLSINDFLEACQRPLRKSIRANPLKMNAQELKELFHNEGFSLEAIPWCEEAFWINEENKSLPDNLGNWLPHLQGCFYIQEASSMLPVKALLDDLELTSTAKILDMAAAPGSKTTQLAATLNNQGIIIANELSSSRLKGLHYNIQRCGITNTCLSHADGRVFGDSATGQFDAILLDAPCGGEGTVRKDDSALTDWSLVKVNAIAELQKELIVSAYKALKPGGRLVYSTCTLSKEENQKVCQHLLDMFAGEVQVKPLDNLFQNASEVATPEGYLHVFPQVFDCEGFFVACFEKTSKHEETSTPSSDRCKKAFTFSPISHKVFEQLTQYCEQYGWDISSIKHNLWTKITTKSQEVWLLPIGTEQLSHNLKLNRYGLKLFDLLKHGIKIQHQAIVSFGQDFSRQTIELTAEQSAIFYQGKDIYLDAKEKPPHNKEFIVTFGGVPLGFVKHLGNKLKNNLPRDLVRDGAFSKL